MIREKEFLRKQVYVALNQEDFETARSIMSKICADQEFPRQNRWTEDEVEFLMHHVSALGVERGCKVVAKKLDRTVLGVRKKYGNELKKAKQKGLVVCH